VNTIEELLGRKRSCSDLESREYCRRESSRGPRGVFFPQKLALTSPTSRGRSVGIFRSRTQATDFICLFAYTVSDRLCGLVFRVPGYRTRGPDPIPGATRISDK
jgi:hypothetical protein